MCAWRTVHRVVGHSCRDGKDPRGVHTVSCVSNRQWNASLQFMLAVVSLEVLRLTFGI